MEKIINITGWEQGSIGSSGLSESNYRIRMTGYFPEKPLQSLKISATSSTGKPLQVDLLGYSDNTIISNIFDKYWYNPPYEFDLSSYSNLKFLRIVLQYTDNTAITPEELSECTVTEYFDWYSDSSGIHCENMPEVPKNAMYSPLPLSLWRISGDVPTHKLFPEVPEKNISAPYPDALWRIDEKIADLPYHKLMPVEIPSGAFMGAKNLEYVRIPETVRKIGRYAFLDTALKKVRISPECKYYETSFPENCVIEFYGNSLNKSSGQLYDCNKNALIDSDGARIYVQEE
ncbi:MAG: leucine-rich repeat domain-containing protein [Ruminococcus sp.]|nr:leucine-rich repeat domain-containing protein [Ruminococcus sp.]